MPRLIPARILRGGVLTITMGLIAGGAALWATARFWAAAPARSTEVSVADLKMSLSSGGFSPLKLTAAGITSNDVGVLVSNARDYLSENTGAISQAQAALGSAQAEVDRLEAIIQQGKAVEGTSAALASARTSLTSAQSAKASALNAFIAATEDGLSEGQRAKLATIRTNATRPVPVEYQLTSRTAAQWMALRDALASNAVRARTGESVDSNCNSIVADANAEHSTVSAKQAIATNLATVQAAFNTAIGS